MRQIHAVIGTLVVVMGIASLAAAGPAQPAFHQEVERLLEQAATELQSLGAQLQQHMQMGRGGMPDMMGRGGMMGSHGMMGPGGGPERPLITIMLHHQGELGLTPDQVSRLEGLRDDFARAAIRRGADLRIAELDLNALLEQDPPDMAKVEAKVREVGQIRTDLRIARLQTIEQGKALLTAEQKGRLRGLLSAAPMGRPAAAPGMRL